MENCVFCKIISGEIDSAKIWEDEEFLAILDINPNTKGVTLVLSKTHYPAYLFDLPNEFCEKFILAAKKVAKLLEKGLGVKRVGMVLEGMGVNHSHLKLYPMYKTDEWKGETPKEKLFFEKYEGHLTTQQGSQVLLDELKKIAKEIKENKD